MCSIKKSIEELASKMQIKNMQFAEQTENQVKDDEITFGGWQWENDYTGRKGW